MKSCFGIALLALLGAVACDRLEHSPAAQREKTLHALAIQRNAVEDWEKPFTNKTSVLTIDLQDVFLNKSAPFEFAGTLEDVRREAGHVVALFTISTAAPFSISLKLICTDEQHKAMTEPSGVYAIIADIQEVEKQGALNVVVPATRNEDGEIDEATLGINWDTDTYCFRGTCRDLRKLDE